MSDGLCEAIAEAFGLPIFRERVWTMCSMAAGILVAKNLAEGWQSRQPPPLPVNAASGGSSRRSGGHSR